MGPRASRGGCKHPERGTVNATFLTMAMAKVVIGGACITEDFAEEIGADAYAKDAADTVRVVERLLQ